MSIFLIITLIIAAILLYCLWKNTNLFSSKLNIPDEGFQVYQQLPFQYMLTGDTPLSYYRLDRYRLPYRYPDFFYSNYPVPHYRYYD